MYTPYDSDFYAAAFLPFTTYNDIVGRNSLNSKMRIQNNEQLPITNGGASNLSEGELTLNS